VKPGLRAILLAALPIAAYAIGLEVGRSSASRERAPRGESYEIRAGGHSYTNPLLECEVDSERLYREIRPFGARLDELAASLEREERVTTIAVYFRDLNNGAWVGHREKRKFVPASLAKMPVVIAALVQADGDPGFLARTIKYAGGDEERDPGFLNPESNLEHGRSYSVDELLRRIARFSDNAAANLLARALPPGTLERVYADLGVDPGHIAAADFVLSPQEYGSFFRVLYNASYLSRNSSERALRYLEESTFELGLVAGVPAGVHVSHKFGVWEDGKPGSPAPLQLHDCGIVYHPNRPYLLCVMTTGKNYVRMATAIEEVSRFVWREVEGNLERPGFAPPPAGG
jgi:beta-lactamase class A